MTEAGSTLRRLPPPVPPSRRTDDTQMTDAGTTLRRHLPPSPPSRRRDEISMIEEGVTDQMLLKIVESLINEQGDLDRQTELKRQEDLRKIAELIVQIQKS